MTIANDLNLIEDMKPLTNTQLIAKLQAENKRLREAGQLLLNAYGEAHALYDLGDCEGSIKMRQALENE